MEIPSVSRVWDRLTRKLPTGEEKAVIMFLRDPPDESGKEKDLYD